MPDLRMIEGDIAELERVFEGGNPSWTQASKLASLYTIRNAMTGETGAQPQQAMVSYAVAPTSSTAKIGNLGNTEFYESVAGKDVDAVLNVMDDLMDTMRVVNIRVYNGVIEKLNRL